MSNTGQSVQKSPQRLRLCDMVKSSTDLWVLSWLLGIVTVVSVIGLLMLSGWFISAAALAGMLALGAHTFNYMMPAAIIRMFAMARTAGRYGELMLSHHAVFVLLKDLRVRFFAGLAMQSSLHSQEHPQFRRLRSAHGMHRLTHDIDVLDEFMLRVVSPWLMAAVLVLALSLMFAWLLPDAAPYLIGLLLLASLMLPAFGAWQGLPAARTESQLGEQLRLALLEPLPALTQLLIWGRWQDYVQRFSQLDAQFLQLHRHLHTRRRYLLLLMQGVSAGLIVLLLLAGVLIINQQGQVGSVAASSVNLTVPLLLALLLGVFGLQEITLGLGQQYLALGRSVGAKQRLNALLDSAAVSSRADIAQPKLPLPSSALQMRLHDVHAQLPNAIVGARQVSFTVHSGQPLWLSGASGCGKSTLLQVLANELPARGGQITLNGQPWQHHDWGEQLGYLGQQLDIFDQSLAANLRLGNEHASDEQLWQVLDKVGLAAWAAAQPDGLQTPLGEYGTAVSGGQARRIALARLLLKPRRVLLLDEPFAGLDAATREQLWQHLAEHQRDGILIVVSHQSWLAAQQIDKYVMAEPS